MGKRKGGLKRRSGRQIRPQQHSSRSLSPSPTPPEASESGSRDSGHPEADLFAHQTLAPSFIGLIASYLAWARLLYLSLSLQDLFDWVSSMLFGLGNLWSGDANQSEEIGLVGQPDSSTKVRRRRRQDAPVGDGEYFPGMVNLSGVLCYMNSVLQSLASVTSLISHLDQITTLAVEADLPTPVTDALTDVLNELNTPHVSPPHALRPHNLISALQPLPQVRRLLATREQQDAHELFVVLAEAISDEALKVAAEVLKLRGLADVLSLQAYCYNKSDKSPSPPPSATMENPGMQRRKQARGLAQPWEGLIARRRVCRRCGWKGEVRMDTLGGMELPVPLQGEVTLDDCIAEYLAPELLSGVNCDFCTLQNTLAYYRSEVARLTVPPSQTHMNGDSQNNHSASGSFSALDGLPDPSASSEISEDRKKKAKRAKKVETRMEEMVQSSSVAGVGEATLASTSFGAHALRVKWQVSNADSIRQTVITRPPRSLRLHIARSGMTPYGTMVKKAAKVAIPLILDITRFTARGVWEERSDVRSLLAAGLKPTETIPRVLYRLDSVILHYGYTSSSGHFICIRRKPVPVPHSEGRFSPSRVRKSCPDGCVCQDCIYFGPVREEVMPGKGWLNISDDEVEEAGAEALLGARAAVFMLFYELVGEYHSTENGSSSRMESESVVTEDGKVDRRYQPLYEQSQL